MSDGKKGTRYLISAFATIATLVLAPLLLARPQKMTGKSFAQALVEEMKAKHPDSDEVGISTQTARGCKTIASTDAGDVGETCEKDDIAPMRTGKPYVEKERDGFDVAVPLRDMQGRIVGSLGVGFKPAAGQTEVKVVAEAQKISKEMAEQIPSNSKLFERVK